MYLKCTDVFAEINNYFLYFFSLDNYELREFVVGCFLKLILNMCML